MIESSSDEEVRTSVVATSENTSLQGKESDLSMPKPNKSIRGKYRDLMAKIPGQQSYLGDLRKLDGGARITLLEALGESRDADSRSPPEVLRVPDGAEKWKPKEWEDWPSMVVERMRIFEGKWRMRSSVGMGVAERFIAIWDENGRPPGWC